MLTTSDFEGVAHKRPWTCQDRWTGWTFEMIDVVSYVVVKIFADVDELKVGVILVLLLAGLTFVAFFQYLYISL
jgi:hypothetical protein